MLTQFRVNYFHNRLPCSKASSIGLYLNKKESRLCCLLRTFAIQFAVIEALDGFNKNRGEGLFYHIFLQQPIPNPNIIFNLFVFPYEYSIHIFFYQKKKKRNINGNITLHNDFLVFSYTNGNTFNWYVETWFIHSIGFQSIQMVQRISVWDRDMIVLCIQAQVFVCYRVEPYC